jgi:hypothetical protein
VWAHGRGQSGKRFRFSGAGACAVKRSQFFILADPAPPLGLERQVNALLLDRAGALELHLRTPIERYTNSTEANSHESSP